MKLWYNLMLFTIFVNIAMYLLQVFGVVGVSTAPQYSPMTLYTKFSIDVFVRNFTLTGVGSVAIMLAGLLLRQGTYALYAMTVFAICTFIPIISDFLLAIPNLIDSVIPAAMNPLYPAANPIGLIFTAIFGFAAFMFLMERITGGPLT